MKRFLGLDLGAVRTGVAVVDDSTKVATPITTIHSSYTSSPFVAELMALIDEWEPVGLVCGLPIDLKGQSGIAAEKVREGAAALVETLNLKRAEPLDLYFVDERLSTALVEKHMMDHDVSAQKRKNMRDALAATVIAQSYIDSI